MKIRGTSRRHITLAVILISIIVVLLITQACSGPSVTSSRTTVTTNQTSTQAATMTTNATTNSTTTIITTSPTTTGQVESTEFQGTKLTPIKDQQLNGISGTINVNQATYTLTIDGLVDHPLTLSYADLEALPQISVLGTLECVEGWSYTAKWTGPSLAAILAQAGVQSGAVIAIFDTADDTDGFTSLDLSYINANNIILALKDNDVTLPAANGFPVRVVASGKYGYKWAKWVTSIELSSNTNFLGYWESNGYNNDGDVNGPAGQ